MFRNGKKKITIKKKKFLIMNSNIMHDDEADLEDIIFRGVTLSITKPYNIVKTDSGHIVQIINIRKQQSVFLRGYTFKYVTYVFQYTCASSKIGIMNLRRLSE